MTNNQDDFNRLINEFANQKSKDRKHHLRIEIAKATDRTVKKALQDILADIQKKERRNRIVGLLIIVVMVLMGFYVIGVTSEKKENQAITQTSTTTSQSQVSSSSEEKDISKEKNLTEAEVKQWVSAIWDKKYQNFPDTYGYELAVKLDDNDQLVYIRVLPPKGIEIDTLGGFRINAKGELEESGYYVAGANIDEWVLVSKTFMDVSQVESYPVPVKESSSAVTNNLSKLTAKEFAELFAEWKNSDYPVMDITEYTEKYGHMNEYDDSIWVITYNDRDAETVQFSEQTPYRMANFFYTFDNRENKAYLNRNNMSGEVEYLSELTEYIKDNR